MATISDHCVCTCDWMLLTNGRVSLGTFCGVDTHAASMLFTRSFPDIVEILELDVTDARLGFDICLAFIDWDMESHGDRLR